MLRVWYSANNGSAWRQGYAERKYTDFLQALNGTNTLVLSGSGTWSQSTQQAARGSGSGRFVQNTGSDFSVAMAHGSYTGFVQEWEMYDSLDFKRDEHGRRQVGPEPGNGGRGHERIRQPLHLAECGRPGDGHQRNPHAGLAHLWHPAREQWRGHVHHRRQRSRQHVDAADKQRHFASARRGGQDHHLLRGRSAHPARTCRRTRGHSERRGRAHSHTDPAANRNAGAGCLPRHGCTGRFRSGQRRHWQQLGGHDERL